ncbi:MAG: CAP domain-containing protein, partial [Candidatus Nitrosopolaris sp.]
SPYGSMKNAASGMESNNSANARQESSSTENATSTGVPENATSPSGSTVNNGTGTTPVNNGTGTTTVNNGTGTTTVNNGTGTTPVNNNTGNASADFVNTILAVHNSERRAVGVPDLVWNDTLASGAKAWAEYLATTGKFEHSSGYMPRYEYGENIAGFDPSQGISAPGGGQMLWVAEKNNYHGGPINETNAGLISHYTMMVWRTTKSIGCATASGTGHPFSILVCRYSPGPTHGGGNTFGEKPY